jgi:hypothetical protein
MSSRSRKTPASSLSGGTTTFSATASTTARDNEPDNDEDSSTVDVGGQTCTIVGTQAANSSFVGTNGPVVICGLGGNDQIQSAPQIRQDSSKRP